MVSRRCILNLWCTPRAPSVEMEAISDTLTCMATSSPWVLVYRLPTVRGAHERRCARIWHPGAAWLSSHCRYATWSSWCAHPVRCCRGVITLSLSYVVVMVWPPCSLRGCCGVITLSLRYVVVMVWPPCSLPGCRGVITLSPSHCCYAVLIVSAHCCYATWSYCFEALEFIKYGTGCWPFTHSRR